MQGRHPHRQQKNPYAVVLAKKAAPAREFVSVSKRTGNLRARPPGNVSDGSPPMSRLETELQTLTYTSPKRRGLAVLLILFFIFQPMFSAYAKELEQEATSAPAEESAQEEASSEEDVATETQDSTEEEQIEEPNVADEESVTTETKAAIADEADQKASTTEPTVSDEMEQVATSTEKASTTPGNIPPTDATSTDMIDVSTSTATTTPQEATTTPQTETGSSGTSEDQEATTTPEVVQDEIQATSTATTTETHEANESSDQTQDDANEPVASSTEEAVIETPSHTIDGAFVFDPNDCTMVNDGEFYCIKKDQASRAESAQLWRVVAEKDADGDKEIFLVTDRDTRRITDNSYDDFAPVYDEGSGYIAWHAMIKDRLQIMLYDVRTGETKQITDETYNSSNPHVFDDKLVWQSWIDNNWEVFFMDDIDTDDPDLKQLTDNNSHDMFPRVYDDMITWQTQGESDTWNVVVYDTKTKRFEYVEKEGNGKYENPRFVLVFDNRTSDGDVEVLGFDMDTKEAAPLAPVQRAPVDPVTPIDDTKDAIPAQATTGTTTIKTTDRRDGDPDVGDGLATSTEAI